MGELKLYGMKAQEMQNGSAEVVVARAASVVGHVAMHQPP